MRAILAVLIAASAPGGCSVAIPLPSLLGDDDATGSIAARAPKAAAPLAPLGPALAASDKPLAQAALNQALDAPGLEPASWINPGTGATGRFQPDPDAADAQPASCRSFLAEIGLPGGPRSFKGLACRAPDGQWSVEQAAPRSGV